MASSVDQQILQELYVPAGAQLHRFSENEGIIS